MNDEPVMAKPTPIAAEVEAGKTYFWCSCGRSREQPFCDGSHQGTDFEPVPYKAEKTGTVYLCGCKRSFHAPICDGTHQSL